MGLEPNLFASFGPSPFTAASLLNIPFRFLLVRIYRHTAHGFHDHNGCILRCNASQPERNCRRFDVRKLPFMTIRALWPATLGCDPRPSFQLAAITLSNKNDFVAEKSRLINPTACCKSHRFDRPSFVTRIC